MTTIGIIGSGNIGGTLAKLFAAAGHDVVVSNSRGPETLADLVAEIGGTARAAAAAEAAAAGEVVVVSVPFLAVDAVPVEPLAGKVVIDTNNYYWERDGHDVDIDEGRSTPSEALQAHLPTSHVVKLFNAIQSTHLLTQGTPAGTDGRRSLPMVGDDADAKVTVAALTDEIGYDVATPVRSPRAGASTATSRRTAPRWTKPASATCSARRREPPPPRSPRVARSPHGRDGVRRLRGDDAVGDLPLTL